MNFLNRDARNFRPRFVGICVVIEKLIAHHQSDRHQSELATLLAPNSGIELLQPIDEEEREEDDILAHLGRRQDGRDPFLKANGGDRFRDKGINCDG